MKNKHKKNCLSKAKLLFLQFYRKETPFSAKLRTTERQPIQENLMFKESVIVTKSRNIEYFTSKWFVTHKSVRELYNKYTTSHPDLPVSLGSFLTLKPFYIRQTTTKDIEMCVCVSHISTPAGLLRLLNGKAADDQATLQQLQFIPWISVK